jgi:tRNA dimethylallyltransferase
MARWDDLISAIPKDAPVLIAGPTASGKSGLALAITEAQGGTVVNADALQVFADWRILTARPGDEDLARAPHALYGQVPGDREYSVGHWLRDVAPILSATRPIIVGGTGLYLTSLTQGLAEIPATPPGVRAAADARLREEGLDSLLAELDPESAARIDRRNPMRVQRAWEVLRATGEGIARWQDRTGPPLLPLAGATALVLSPPREALGARIDRRFDAMLAAGLMDEVARNAPGFSPALPASKAIGAAELVACHRGEMPLQAAAEQVRILTRQYAKRQRTWLRSKMGGWKWIDPEG